MPHRLELVRSTILPPTQLTSTAFVLVITTDGRLLLTCIDRVGRGWDVPGGHLESGETTQQAAVRELAEETGYVLNPAALSVAGWYRTTFDAPPPPQYRYPHPVSYMVGFVARVDDAVPAVVPLPGSESIAAQWCDQAKVARLCPEASWLPLLDRELSHS